MGPGHSHRLDGGSRADRPAAETSGLGLAGVQDPRLMTALFWSAWALVLTVAVTLIALWAVRSREAALASTRGDVVRTARQGAAYVGNVVGLADEVLTRLSANTSEADLNNLAFRLCPSLVCADYGRSERAMLIAFARSNGNVVIAGANASPASLADRDYFMILKAADVGLSIGKPRRNRVVEGTYLPMARRLAPGDGAFHGIVAAAVNVDLFRAFFQGLGIGTADQISLRDAGGKILVRWPEAAETAVTDPTCGPATPAASEDIASSERLRLGGLSVDVCRSAGNALRAWRKQVAMAAGGALALLLAPALAFPTFRRRWERRLRQQAGLRGLVAGSSDVQFIVAAKPDGTFVLEALTFTQGGPLDRVSARLVGRTTRELFPAEEAASVNADYRSVLASGEMRRIERQVTLGGTRFVWSTLLVPLREAGGGYIFGAASDLGGDGLREGGLRGFTESVLRREDSERRRIARELHDTTGQKLIAAGFELGAVARALGNAPPHVRESLGEARRLVDASVSELRTLSYVLYPPFLDEAGLGLALTTLAEGFGKRTGLSVAVSVAADLEGIRWAPEVELALYRVAQEALTNVQRHAPEKEALVVLASDAAGRLEMAVSNGGVFDGRAPAASVAEGAGVRGMRDRLEALGGSLTVVRTEDGFRVAATIPAEPVSSASAG